MERSLHWIDLAFKLSSMTTYENDEWIQMKACKLTNGQIQYVVCSFRLRLAVFVRSWNACGIFAERYVFLFWSCFNMDSAQDLENKTWIQPFLERDSSGNPRHNTSRITPEKRFRQSACSHEFETVTSNNKSELCPTYTMWVGKSSPPPSGNRRKFILCCFKTKNDV